MKNLAEQNLLNVKNKIVSDGFSGDDFDDIRHNLEFWENDFERRVGVPYDSGNIKREI